MYTQAFKSNDQHWRALALDKTPFDAEGKDWGNEHIIAYTMAHELAGGVGGGKKGQPSSISGIFHGGVTPLQPVGP
jgi:hypothetical protein